MIHGRRPHAPCRGRACPSRRCTNDWNNVPLKRHAPIASVAALSERHAHPRITERPRRPHAPCRGRAVPSRRCTNDWNNVPLKRHAPIASVAALSERHAHPRITERPRRPHAPCRGRAVPSRRCTNDWNNVPLKRHAPIASVAALSERHAHPRITERPRRPHAPCRGRAVPSRRCTGVISGPSIKRGWPPRFVIARRPQADVAP